MKKNTPLLQGIYHKIAQRFKKQHKLYSIKEIRNLFHHFEEKELRSTTKVVNLIKSLKNELTLYDICFKNS